MKVTILLCNSTNAFMRMMGGIIRWGQGTDYSHMGILFDGVLLKTKDVFGHVVMDATLPDGVAVHPMNEFKKKYKTVRKIDIYIDASSAEVKTFISMYLGKKYSWMGIVGFGMMKLGLTKTNPFGANSKMIVCSELPILLLAHFGLYKIESDIDNYDLKTTEEILNKI